ncbi:MAG: hypothetical protein ACU0BF_06415 [Paracoccaceae bacterium]
MRLATLTLLAAVLTQPALAEGRIAAPVAGIANYDPTLSAKEAVLANWDLAAAGIRAGAVLGGRVVDMAERGQTHARLVRQAQTAQRTLIQRWGAAQWIYGAEAGLARLDGAALRDVADAVAAPCPADPCAAQIAAITAAFGAASEQMEAAAADARTAIEARMQVGDMALMAEQLSLVADYLEGVDWAEDLALVEFGLEGQEVAARIVGALAIWRNVEPYVGLTSPEIDAAINAQAEATLRHLRLAMDLDAPLDMDGTDVAELRARTAALGAEFRRAAALFPVG